ATDLGTGVAAVEGEGRIAGEIGDLKVGLPADLEAGANIMLATNVAEVVGELQILVGCADGLRERANRAKTLNAKDGDSIYDGLIGGVLEAEYLASVVFAERSLGQAESPAAVKTEAELIEHRGGEGVDPCGGNQPIGEREAFAAQWPQVFTVAGLLGPGEGPENLIARRYLVIQPHV